MNNKNYLKQLITSLAAASFLLLGSNARADDATAEGLIKSCRLAVRYMDRTVYNPDEAMAIGTCWGMALGMMNAKYAGCGSGLPGWDLKGFVVALEDTKTKFQRANDWWPNNPAGWLANEAFKSVETKKDYRGVMCPTGRSDIVFFDLYDRYR